MCFEQNFLVNVTEDFNDQGYNLNHIAEMTIITIDKKMDVLYEFYTRHKKHAVEWKLNAKINKNENLISELDRSKRHHLFRKFRCVPMSNTWSKNEREKNCSTKKFYI